MSKRKILKRILVTLLIIIVVLAVGVYCVFNFYIKPKYSQKLIEAVNMIMEDEELMSDIEDVLSDAELQQEIGEALGDEAVQTDIAAALTDPSIAEAVVPTETPKSDSAATPQNSEIPQNNEEHQQPAPTEKPSTEGKSMMQIAKENVEPADFAAGMKMAGKIDIGYLMGLTKGGLTAEEKTAAKSHLKSRLSGAEISKLKGFIAKYSHLLN